MKTSSPVIATALTMLFCASAAHAVLAPDPHVDLGVLAPGSHSATIELPDDDPNILWFGFELTSTASVGMHTFDSELGDTVLALFDMSGNLLGQNDDCDVVPDPANEYQSCLFFADLGAAVYRVGIVEWTMGGRPNYDYIAFTNPWAVTETTDYGDDDVTLSLQVESSFSLQGSASIPSPATTLLFAAGIAGMGYSRRRQAR